MKFSLVACLVVILALAIGSESVSLVKREAPELEKLTQVFKDLTEALSRTTQEMVEKVKSHELTGQTMTYLDSGKAQLQLIVEEFRKQLEQQEQLKPLTESIQAKAKPLADSLQAQFQALWQQVMDQVKALPAPASQ